MFRNRKFRGIDGLFGLLFDEFFSPRLVRIGLIGGSWPLHPENRGRR